MGLFYSDFSYDMEATLNFICTKIDIYGIIPLMKHLFYLYICKVFVDLVNWKIKLQVKKLFNFGIV